jgi:hypothetical protein
MRGKMEEDNSVRHGGILPEKGLLGNLKKEL